MRPLWWDFPEDAGAVGVNDQYMLGPDLLLARRAGDGPAGRHVAAGLLWPSHAIPEIL